MKSLLRKWLERAPTASQGTQEATNPPQLADLERAISDLTTRLNAIQYEWAEVLDKINHWAARQAARDRRAAMAALESPRSDEGGDGGPHTQPSDESPADRKLALRRRVFSGGAS